jgi:hypothetical protein
MSTVKERPILMSAPMVRAILEGRKTQTRRVMKGGPFWTHLHVTPVADSLLQFVDDDSFWVQLPKKDDDFTYATGVLTDQGRRIRCPYGKRGDRLWVQEAWKTAKINDHLSPAKMVEACRDAGWKSGRAWAPIEYLADGRRENWDTFPRENGRYRSPRFMPRDYSRIMLEITDVRVQRLQEISEEDVLAEGCTNNLADGVVSDYHTLWESINGPGSWNLNPWVWAVTFKQVLL